jgi:subtilisin family serine protease
LHENLAQFSSGGPTFDGRIKPDLVAPGDSIDSADLTGSGDTCGTVKKSGTSMATPLAAGAMALLRQYFTDGFYPTGTKTSGNDLTPSAALLRAVAINGARSMKGFDQYGNPLDPPPSPRQGWGRLNLASSVLLVSTG